MYNHKNHITKLFFWKWYLNFGKLTNQMHLYKRDLLAEKLWQHLFFHKVQVEGFPFYNFWGKSYIFILNFSALVKPESLARYEQKFVEAPEKFLRDAVYNYINNWRHFLQLLRDFWMYYPRYQIPFDNIECIYIDVWSELPKAIDSLLSELLVRDSPLREGSSIVKDKASLMMVTNLCPPVLPGLFTEEELNKRIVEYLLGEDEAAAEVTLQIITFYLEARPEVKQECLALLEAKALPINDASLMKCFFVEYIFKGVSNEGKRFFVANCDLEDKNPFKKFREKQQQSWNEYTVEEQQKMIRYAKKSLQQKTEELALENSLTVEEKAERHRKLIEAEEYECG